MGRLTETARWKRCVPRLAPITMLIAKWFYPYNAKLLPRRLHESLTASTATIASPPSPRRVPAEVEITRRLLAYSSLQFRKLHDAPVQRNNPVHVEIEPLDILVEVHHVRVRIGRRGRVRRQRRVNVHFHQQLLLRQPGHDDAGVVRIVLDEMKLHGPRAVG